MHVVSSVVQPNTVIRIGVGASFWGHDQAEPRDLAQGLSWIRAAGFIGAEVVLERISDPRTFQSALLQYDLRLIGGNWSTRLLERSVSDEFYRLEPFLNVLVGLGADVLVVTEVVGSVHQDPRCPPSQRSGLFPALRRRLAEQLSALAGYAGDRGIQLVYRPRMGTVIQSEGEIVDLLEQTSDRLGLLLDTGHLTYAGVSSLDLVDAFGARVHHVYLKDVRPGVLEVAELKNASFPQALADGVFTVPGEGMVHFEALMSTLVAAGYHGWLVVDTEREFHERDIARAVHERVAAWVRDA